MTTSGTERLLDQMDAARNAQAIKAAEYKTWLSNIRPGDEVAAVSLDDDWVYVAEVSTINGQRIRMMGSDDLVYYFRDTGLAPGIFRQKLVPVTDELIARSNHYRRARRLGDMDWSKLPPALVREIALMVDNAKEGK